MTDVDKRRIGLDGTTSWKRVLRGWRGGLTTTVTGDGLKKVTVGGGRTVSWKRLSGDGLVKPGVGRFLGQPHISGRGTSWERSQRTTSW